jgi:hypothetical protein
MDMTLLKNAAREGLKRVASSSGHTMDQDLLLYKQLKPSDFPKIIEKYGVEGTLDYIKAMEAKLKEKGK